jgi:hypothetical protein
VSVIVILISAMMVWVAFSPGDPHDESWHIYSMNLITWALFIAGFFIGLLFGCAFVWGAFLISRLRQ